MPLQTTSGAASYDAFGGGVPIIPNYIEEVFSTYLWTGNGTTQTITNDIDLSTKGGLVWSKNRAANTFGSETHELYDTTRGTGKALFTNNADAQENFGTARGVTAFSTSGFTVKNGSSLSGPNSTGITQVGWTFRKQPKFFDVVTWSGNSTSGRQIPHNLGSVPGCIFVKRTSGAANWIVYHRSTGNTKYLLLNGTALADNDVDYWSSTTPTSTNFTVNSYGDVNASGSTYVAYIFAHDAGGFGLTGTDNVISCGSFTGGTGGVTVTLGYEPQWVMVKNTDASGLGWYIWDNMRGFPVGTGGKTLNPNSSDAEATTSWISPTSTGFVVNPAQIGAVPFIYIAIRRGPMKVPTVGTSVFNALLNTGTDAAKKVTGTGFPVDLAITKLRNANGIDIGVFDRLRGSAVKLSSTSTGAEGSSGDAITGFDTMDGMAIGVDSDFALTNRAPNIYVYECFRRAPSFFDEVCFSGSGAASFNHNLGAVPELMIIKQRATAGNSWGVYSAPTGNNYWMALQSTMAPVSDSSMWNDTTPTSSVFTIGSTGRFSGTCVAYLFSTCAGVSKVFSYTGNGSSQTINCGFTGGARFVLIKRTESTGDWYVWDSARGIVSGNDPHLSLNTTSAEVTTDDTIDTDSTGFVVNQVSATDVNVSSATYIGLAIA